MTHSIDTGDNKPIRQLLRRNPLPHLQAIWEQTKEMLRQDIIEPAVSEWTSNVVLVKKDKSLKYCIDYSLAWLPVFVPLYPLILIEYQPHF